MTVKLNLGGSMLYVVDTSVFLSDPRAFERLRDKNIIIPFVVLNELESKRNHPELGFSARQALRFLEEKRKENSLINVIENKFGGSIKIELNHIDDQGFPQSFKDSSNDSRILAVAFNLSKETDVTLLTKDLPLRIKASILGVLAEDYLEDNFTEFWSGIENLSIGCDEIDKCYEEGSIFSDLSLTQNSGVLLSSGTNSALAKYQDGKLKLVKDKAVFDVRGRSAEQRIALDFLTDNSINIVSLGGSAGTGKSLLAIAAGLESVIENRNHKKVIVFRPLYAVGGQDLGYLPGTAEEKMSPWAAAVFDALEVFCGPNVIETVVEDNLLEVLPLTHIRGRTLSDSYVIIDEAQNLEKVVLLTALTRLGQNSKVVLTHDISQRDNLRVGKHDGILSVISALKNERLFAHVTLQKSERSEIAKIVSQLIDT